MSLHDDIIKLLKAEGYRINEVIRDAIDELIEVVKDEDDTMSDEDDFDDEDDDPEPEE